MNILEEFCLILTQRKNKITPVLFNNTPISNVKDDIFGFKEQVNILDGAIENGSVLIGIIGDYGSGKSSLTEICQKELYPKYGQAIRINMWDTIEEKKKRQDFRFLIRSFLYQLAQGNKKTNINFARYINERQSKNYGKLSLTMASRLALIWFFLAGLFFITYLALKNDVIFNSIVAVFEGHNFFEALTNENFFRILSYPILLFSIIFVYMGIRTGSFVFSLWDSQGKMNPEYGDIFDNFIQIMNRLVKYQWWEKIFYLVVNIIKLLTYPIIFIGLLLVYITTKIGFLLIPLKNSQKKTNLENNNILDNYIQNINWITKFMKKKKIIYIEDLDRINDKQFVLSFLNELHRFINILPNEQKKRVAFIVSLKSEPSLRNDLNKKEIRFDDKSTYSKIFDYTLWIKPIHYENISDVIWELLYKNQKSIKSILGLDKKTELKKTLLNALDWIQKGEKLTIREIKDRLNETFILYHTLKARNFENSSVELKKCCAVAYLHRTYPDEYEELLKHERKMAELIRNCYLWQKTDEKSITQKVEDVVKELFSNVSQNIQCFADDLTKMIFNADIDEDFMMYFYNYPTSSYIKNLDEKEMLDYILHPSDKYKSDKNLTERINLVITLKKGKVINEAIDELKEKKQYIPDIVFEYERLFLFVFKNNSYYITTTLNYYSAGIITNPSKICGLLEKILFYNIDEELKNKIVKSIINKLVISMKGHNPNEIYLSRATIIKSVKSKIYLFCSLFIDENLPLITKQELQLLNLPDEKLLLINSQIIDVNNYEYIFDEIINLELNESQYLKAEELFSNINNIDQLPNIHKYLFVFLSRNKKYSSRFFSLIIDNIDDTDKLVFCEYLNTIDISLLTEEQLNKIDEMKLKNIFDEKTILFLEEKKLYQSALLSRVTLGIIDNFDFLKNDLFSDVPDYFKDVYKEFPEDFLAIRFAAFKQLHDKPINLYKLFLSGFPLISDYEIDLIDDTGYELYMYIAHSSVNIKNYKVLVEYCNKKNFDGDKLFNFFISLFFNENSKISDVDCIKFIFSGIDFKNVIHFESMALDQQKIICKNLRSIYNLTTASGSIEFMKIVNCLIPELEEVIINNMDGDAIKYSDYLDLINEIKKPTKKTNEIIDDKPLNQALDQSITDKLYNNEYYIRYLIGKSLRDNSVLIDKKIPIEKYYDAFILSDKFAELCSKYENILSEFVKNKLLDDDITDASLIYFYKIRQPLNLVKFILTRLQGNDEETKKYLYSITDIDTENDADKFIDLITSERYIGLLRDRNMFYFLYHKMWNRKMKQKLTLITNRILKIDPKYSSKEAGDFDESSPALEENKEQPEKDQTL